MTKIIYTIATLQSTITLNLTIGSPNPVVRTFISMIVWRMHQLRSWGFDLREPLLGQGHVSWPIFLANFRIFGILGFESRYRPPDQGVHSGHPCDAFERRSKSSGAHPWPDFSTFLVHMVVGFLVTRNCMKFSGLILRFRDGQPYLQPSRGNHG